MGEWKETTLGQVIELKRGYDLPQQQRESGKVPLVSSSGVSDFHSTAMVKGPGVVTGRYGTIGQVYYIEKDFWPLNTTLYVRDFKNNDPRFISYFLQSVDFFAYSDKAAVPGVNRNHLHQALVKIPPLPEQRAIAHILGTLDDKIELNRRMNETLEAMARALFKSWFVDFEPVRAKSEGRDTGLPKEIADLFPDSFEDSELGEVPKGWRVDSFASTVEIIGGGTPKTSVAEYWDGDIPWFSVVDAPNETDVFVIDTQKKITQAGLEGSSTRLLPEGSTIISARGTVGKVALVGVSMTMNQSCYGLRSLDNSHYFAYFSTRTLIDTLQQRSHGSVFDTITRDTLAGITTVVPSSPVKRAFELKVTPIMQRIRSNLIESAILNAQRDTLLPKLLSGEIRVRG